MLRSVAVVMRGTILAQAVGILILPVLTRSFSPAAFGHFQVFQSILALLLVVATMRYEIAILRAESPRELGALLALCAAINLGLTLLLAIGGPLYEMLTKSDFERAYGFPTELIAGAFLTGGFIQFFGYFLVREKLFSHSSNSKVVQALANAGTALALAATRPIASGIVVADFVGRVGGALTMALLALRRFRAAVVWPSRGDIVAAAVRFREYPLVAVPGGIVNMAGNALTPIMIYQTFDAATSGQFGLLERAATLPIGLIAVSVSQVYVSQLAEDLRTRVADPLHRFLRLIALLAALSILPAIVLGLLAPWLFRLVFGLGWEQAALFAQLMLPAYCLSLLAGAINMTLVVVGWQKTQLAWEASRLAAMSALWIGGARFGWSVETMVMGHSAILTSFSMVIIGLSGWAIRVTAGSSGPGTAFPAGTAAGD